ncbi:exodeoxyribonuclease VII large subunit [Fredinandcohnia quinoae]|uniref:Exodeoxyribonuclease 7 large subunit n=1 Tax=Fredinandcohnia quinoae TaxID=2918902 RepID=A0AAW5E6U5_9BACI|nr:exodeoxyribonuclease VII large subunit [Fredinandcohnia sp. SECRCQ15]MCH1626629.1 exodeoxyribonuclease VII large subunit [Fredinandcohnia sp. SECRCQ15]
MTENRYLTVTALTKYIKRKFDADPHLQDIWVKGEISNFKAHSRGHMYFTIKDQNARISAVMFSSNNRSLKFTPENGMKVLVRGEITVFESSGNYQIYVKEMQPDGIGNLYLAYEELKKRLDAEGLFLEEYKKPIPKIPHHIGIITSPTGAAIRDIISTIRRRYPIAKVIVIPALVQGTNAAPSIVKAISTANMLGYLDVLIIGRGGGSIEELWAFNEEIVAREIFKSSIPIISAVGHETDITITDFVADLRAPTPTGAAELAVPHLSELMERLLVKRTRLLRVMKERLNTDSKRLSNLQKSYAFRFPKNLYVQKEQQLDRVVERLEREGKLVISRKLEFHNKLSMRLSNHHPKEKLERAKAQQVLYKKMIIKEMNQLVNQKKLLFSSTLSKLEALSPLKIMERGYSLVYNEQKQIVKSVRNIEQRDIINVKLKDGQLACEVVEIKESEIHE